MSALPESNRKTAAPIISISSLPSLKSRRNEPPVIFPSTPPKIPMPARSPFRMYPAGSWVP